MHCIITDCASVHDIVLLVPHNYDYDGGY